MKSHALPVVLLTTLMLFGGCGSSDPLSRQAVSGSITLNGEPVSQGSIDFTPTGSTGTMSGAAVTDGKFLIPQEKGLSPGEYLVRISAPSADKERTGGGDFPAPARELIPPQYNTRSQEKILVEAGKPNQFDFEIRTSK